MIVSAHCSCFPSGRMHNRIVRNFRVYIIITRISCGITLPARMSSRKCVESMRRDFLSDLSGTPVLSSSVKTCFR